jgi:hypothetical protein
VIPSVVAEPPSSSWTEAAAVAPPSIAEGSGASVVQWSALRDGRAPEATLVTACIAATIPGWVEDMRPAIEARATGIVASTAERLARAPIEAREEDGVLVLRSSSAREGRLGTARTFLGFDEDRVFTCFAACVTDAPVRGAVACDAAVGGARLEGSLGPPRPGLALRAVTWAVHHPRETAAAGAVLTIAFGVLAVTTRRRPRVRI